MKPKILAQGAEAKIILFNNSIVKDRVPKPYRLNILDDKIRKLRTRSEVKLLEKASKIINVPKTIESNENQIVMEFIQGKKLSENLDPLSLTKQKQILSQIGKDVSKLHDNSIIHGDLTTSNIILKENKVFFIDFGLGFISHKLEDKAVDLHLLKQALEAKHFKNWENLWKKFENSYNSSQESKKVLERLKAVEKRGKYKERY